MIKSVLWANMLDYPGHVSTSIFFENCNFKCEYCHNQNMHQMKSINFETEVLPKLLERKQMVSHVILSGGECTVDNEIQKIIDTLYKNGFKIGLHTNGSRPEFLEKNIKKISYIGMDIKTDLDKYDEVAGVKIDIEKIKKSIDLIINNLKSYEFRTTVYPKYMDTQDCINVAKYLSDRGANNYVLQQYKKISGLAVIPFSNEKMNEIVHECSKFLPTKVRGLMK